MPPAPPTSSTMTCWPKISESRALKMRAKMSSEEPAANVTTRVTGRTGHSWACAGRAAEPNPTNAAAPAARCREPRRGIFMGPRSEIRETCNSIQLDVGGPDDRCPARDLALDQRGQGLLPASRFVRNLVSELTQALARGSIVERLVERLGEPVEDRLRRRLGCEKRIPAARLELRKPGLPGRGQIRQLWTALGRCDRIGLDGARLQLRSGGEA